jgi:hypothetical protein
MINGRFGVRGSRFEIAGTGSFEVRRSTFDVSELGPDGRFGVSGFGPD